MAEFPHPIGQRAGKRSFPLLGHIPLRLQSAGERPLVQRKNTLGVTLRMVARRTFPLKPTVGLDCRNMPISLGR